MRLGQLASGSIQYIEATHGTGKFMADTVVEARIFELLEMAGKTLSLIHI